MMALKKNEPLILASASPRRKILLRKLGLPFEIEPSTARELSASEGSWLTPSEFALCNAARKAAEVAKRFPNRLILAADTIVVFKNKIYGKPRDLSEAKKILLTLSGQTHQVLTAVAIIDPKQKQKSFVEKSKVTFRKLSSQQIERYLKEVQVLDKAGAYALQEKGDSIVAKIEGLRSNVIGLPIERLKFLTIQTTKLDKSKPSKLHSLT